MMNGGITPEAVRWSAEGGPNPHPLIFCETLSMKQIEHRVMFTRLKGITSRQMDSVTHGFSEQAGIDDPGFKTAYFFIAACRDSDTNRARD